MTIAQLIAALKAIGIPCAYDHFNSEQNLPFICYLFVESNDYKADNTVYLRKGEFDIELYTSRKDPVTEKKIYDILDAHEVPYKKYEDHFDEENYYLVK